MSQSKPVAAIVDMQKVGGKETAIHKAIDLVGGFYPPENSIIAIKPNLCTARKVPETGVVTPIETIKAIINYINKYSKNTKILIIESNSDKSADEAFQRYGYKELEGEYPNVKLKNLNKDRVIKIIPKYSHKVSVIEIPETLLTITHLISIAQLKRHVNERYTGAWKNLYGLLVNKPLRIKMHPFLAEVLYAVNTMFWPDLSIIDAEIALEGPGPIEGNPVYIGKILCSKNPIALDIVAMRLIGERPSKAPHLAYAIKRLRMREENISIIGDAYEPTNLNFIKEWYYLLYRFGLHIRRISEYLSNIGYTFSISAYALRTFGFSTVAKGMLFPLKEVINLGRDLVFKIEVAERMYG